MRNLKLTLAIALTLVSARLTAAPLPAEVRDSLTTQVNHEMGAAYIYLDMANHFDEQALYGFGHFFRVHFYEEINHARLMMKYLVDKGESVVLKPVPAPEAKHTKGKHVDVVQTALTHEIKQTARIEAIYQQAKDLKAYDAETFLIYFVNEQVEEESLFTDVLMKVQLVQGSPEGLLALDRELAARPFPPLAP